MASQKVTVPSQGLTEGDSPPHRALQRVTVPSQGLTEGDSPLTEYDSFPHRASQKTQWAPSLGGYTTTARRSAAI
ncbi:hypothetical protein ACOMHN_000132 [Nucella lapillus]